MRRALAIVAGAAAVGIAVLFALGASSGHHGPRYWVELDNAFGLIQGGDLKIAGVRAGKITQLKLDTRTHRALVQVEVDRTGWGSLRADVRCASRPQSLIGEYYLDCAPGTSRTFLNPGARIPVTQTSSTIAPDLINDIMRRPYRQRLSIILGELGAGVAGRGADLGAAIRRASPALAQTDRVLAMLARQNATLRQLIGNADQVVGDLAANHRDVGRWVVQARNTAQASARRRTALAAGFQRLPAFLEQLRPAMAQLGDVARAQTPALRNLDASSQRLQDLFEQLRPFAEASRPAFDALGKASETGKQAVRSAGPVVDQLAGFSGDTPELARNLAIVLEHLDDRRWAVEPDPRSPGGKGYTGLEALLTYVYDQTMATNAFDSNMHYLKVAADVSECSHYADIAAAKKVEAKCGSRVGPHAIGFNFADPTAGGDNGGSSSPADHQASGTTPASPGSSVLPDLPSLLGGDTPAAPAAPAAPSDGGGSATTPVPVPSSATPPPAGSGGGSGSPPPVPLPSLPSVPPVGRHIGLSARHRATDPRASVMLLDYLLGP